MLSRHAAQIASPPEEEEHTRRMNALLVCIRGNFAARALAEQSNQCADGPLTTPVVPGRLASLGSVC